MLAEGYLICKDYDGKIEVNGINMYEPNTVQFTLYKWVEGDLSSIMGDSYLNTETREKELKNSLLVFPFQCGIKFGNGYHLMHIKDCIGILPIEKITKAYEGEL